MVFFVGLNVVYCGCERCGRVYLAILRNGGCGWLQEISRDARMSRVTVKRHLEHLLSLGLVVKDGNGIYWIRDKWEKK